MYVIDIVHQLRIAQGKINKIKVLHAHIDNEEWRTFLLWVFNPYINYYVSAPTQKSFKKQKLDGWFYHQLSSLSNREVTGTAAKNTAYILSETYGEAARLVLDRNLRCGVQVKTINEAYGRDFIPTFNIMLGKGGVEPTFPAVLSTKMDGVRLLAFVDKDHKVVLRTRSGKIALIGNLSSRLSKLDPGVYDGELASLTGKQKDRAQISGQVNRSMHGQNHNVTDGYFYIFDFIKQSDWDRQLSTIPYAFRYQHLQDNVPHDLMFGVLKQETVNSPTDVERHFTSTLEEGYEGVMVRYVEDPYIFGRTKNLIKFKAIKECVLECTGEVEGKGKYQGVVGALVCQGEVESKQVVVNVGTGLSDWDRDQSFNYYIGKDIEVEYNSVTMNKDTGEYSLFLPRYKRVSE